MSKLLDLKLTKHGERGLSVEILHQEESLRSKGSTVELYRRDGMTVQSKHIPDLTPETLYLKGTEKDEDFYTPQHFFASRSKRDKMHDFILEALEHINKDVPEIVRFYECIGIDLWYSEDRLKFYNGLKVFSSIVSSIYQKTGRYIDVDIKTDKPVGKVGVEQ